MPAGGAPAARLTGPLARARIAGPGYTVWVIGLPQADGIDPRAAARRLASPGRMT